MKLLIPCNYGLDDAVATEYLLGAARGFAGIDVLSTPNGSRPDRRPTRRQPVDRALSKLKGTLPSGASLYFFFPVRWQAPP